MTTNNPYADLEQPSETKEFEPPVRESSLRQHSAKLAANTRLFPEWSVASHVILRKKYPSLGIGSMSELIGLIVQDYIKQNFELVDNLLPPTENAINFLLQQGFVNPDSKEQFRLMSKAEQRAREEEERIGRTTNLKELYEYWKGRDPQKAEMIMEQITQKAIEGLGEVVEEEKQTPPSKPQAEETISTEHQSFEDLLEKQARKKEKTDLAQQINLEDIQAVPENEGDDEEK